MPIIFIRKRKKQTYLFIALIVIVLVMVVVLWPGFLRKKPLTSLVIPGPVISGYPEIEINFGILEKPELKELIPFQEISPFEREAGRENPFLPY